MIAGLGISGGVATAMRSAARARETMDTMTRQIATGQRVSSARDDGAAFTRASELRAQKTQYATAIQTLNRVEVGVRQTSAVNDIAIERLDTMRQLVLQAHSSPPNSPARQALQAEWSGLVNMPGAFGENYGFANWDNWAGEYSMNPADPLFDGVRLFAFAGLNQGWGDFMTQDPDPLGGRPVRIDTINLATATTAQLNDTSTTIDTYQNAWQGWSTRRAAMIGAMTGMDLAMIDGMRDRFSTSMDRLDRQIGTLTDADLGKASAARATAQTRQQISLSTVRQALDTYQAYAGGLLGNVQRTQRAIV